MDVELVDIDNIDEFLEQNDILYECILKFNQLLNKTYMYKLDGGISFKFKFKKSDFPHLIGLQKLTDINMFNALNNKDLKGDAEKMYRKILNKDVTYSHLCESTNFDKIESRLEYFLYVEDVLFSELIINFDKSKLKSKDPEAIASTLKSNMILYAKKGDYFLHLCIYNKNNLIYAESFFPRKDKYYINGQTKKIVLNVKVLDKKNNITKEYDFKSNRNLKKIK